MSLYLPCWRIRPVVSLFFEYQYGLGLNVRRFKILVRYNLVIVQRVLSGHGFKLNFLVRSKNHLEQMNSAEHFSPRLKRTKTCRSFTVIRNALYVRTVYRRWRS